MKSIAQCAGPPPFDHKSLLAGRNRCMLASSRPMKTAVIVLCGLCTVTIWAEPQPRVIFSQSAVPVPAYRFVEITAQVDGAFADNPFTDASFTGTFSRIGSSGDVT